MTLRGLALTDEQVRAVEADEEALTELLFPETDADERRRFDLDKAWHGIHFLLTGSEWDITPPLGLAVLGGRPVGDDHGYGPARLLEPGEVRAVADALGGLDLAALRASYDPAKFASNSIYPVGAWDQSDLDGFLLPYLQELTDFYRAAADAGHAVVLLVI